MGDELKERVHLSQYVGGKLGQVPLYMTKLGRVFKKKNGPDFQR
jgi:hypothetical protein